MKKHAGTMKLVIIYGLMIFCALIMLTPFAWMLSASLKLEKDVFAYPIKWIPKNPVWSNYILMHAFTAMGVFLIRQFYMGIPNELLEAARIDGLSEYGILVRIMLPLSKPAIATMAITSFVFEWNDFMGPLIYLSSTEKKTIQLLIRLFNSMYSTNYAWMMAAAVIALIPVFIIFIALQKYFVQGVATSGLKG